MASITRRNLLYQTSALAPLLLTGSAAFATQAKKTGATLLENLGQQHGIVVSMLLVYVHAIDQLEHKKDTDFQALSDCRELVREYIENFHERVAEEQYVFANLDKAHKLTELLLEVRAQHQVSRQMTDKIGLAIQKKSLEELVSYLQKFVTMYLAHAAWEDMIIFPAFRPLVSDKEYTELGAKLQDEERKLFGKEGLEAIVGKVNELKRRVGLNELSAFTPKV